MGYYRKNPVVVEAHQWFRNGSHPDDFSDRDNGNGAMNLEGMVVARYRLPRPDDNVFALCKGCQRPYHAHGWIRTLEGGHIVCPGDWIITGVKGEHYPCKPDVFEETYHPV